MATLTSQIFNQEFNKRKQRNPRYSLRAFAKDLGLHSGTLSSIMQGRRKVPLHMFEHLSEKIGALSEQREELRSELKRAKKTKVVFFKYDRVVDERVWSEIVSDGFYFTLLTLFLCKNFRSDPTWMAERLSVSPDRVKKALEFLVNAGFLKVENAAYKLQSRSHSTRDNIPSEAIKKAHEEILETAKKRLRSVPVTHRDYFSIKIPADPQKIELARKEIRKFKKKMMGLLDSPQANEVYELAIQLFPRTEIEVKEECVA